MNKAASAAFTHYAMSDTPETLAELVRDMTAGSINNPEKRENLIDACIAAADELIRNYDHFIPQIEKQQGGDNHLSPKSVTAWIYKAAYLSETVFTLSANGSEQQMDAQRRAWAIYTRLLWLKDEKPNWMHPFPISAKIAQHEHAPL